MLPLNPSSLCPRQPAGRASKADPIRLPHQWHRRQPLPHPHTRGQHITTFQRNNPPSSHHQPVPQTWLHHLPWSCSTLPRQGWTRRGAPCHCLNRTMTPLRTRGTPTTSDHAAAASEAPIMLYPWMIHTPTTPSHTFFVFSYLCVVLFQQVAIRQPSSSDTSSPQSTDQHTLFHFAQRKTVRLSGGSLNNLLTWQTTTIYPWPSAAFSFSQRFSFTLVFDRLSL